MPTWTECREPHFRLCFQDPQTVSLQFVVICYSGHRKSHTLLELRELAKNRLRLVRAHTQTHTHGDIDTHRHTDTHRDTHTRRHRHTHGDTDTHRHTHMET